MYVYLAVYYIICMYTHMYMYTVSNFGVSYNYNYYACTPSSMNKTYIVAVLTIPVFIKLFTKSAFI